MKKIFGVVLTLLFCLSATACVGAPRTNFGLEFAERYAALEFNEISAMIGTEADVESFREALAFDGALAGLGATLVPLSSVGRKGGYEITMRVNVEQGGRTLSHVQTYLLHYDRENSETFATGLEIEGLTPFSGTAEDGVRACLEAWRTGDFVRAAGLLDIWEGDPTDSLQELYLRLMPELPEITDETLTVQGDKVVAELTLNGKETRLVFSPRMTEGGIRYRISTADLSTVENACRAFFEAYGALDAEKVLDVFAYISEEEADTVRGVMLLLRMMLEDAQTEFSLSFERFEPLSETPERVTGLMIGQMKLTDPTGTQVQSVSLEAELVLINGEWRFVYANLPEPDPEDPDQNPEDPDQTPDYTTAERALSTYFAALNRYDNLAVVNMIRLEGLTSDQIRAVQIYYEEVAKRDLALNYQYEYDWPTLVYQDDGYVEFSVPYRVREGEVPALAGIVFLDFIHTDEGWMLVPENYIFESMRVPRPDFSGLSPKYGLIRYLELLPCGDADRILDCFDLSGMSEGEQDSFRRTVEDYAQNTWNTYVFEFGTYLPGGETGILIEAHLRINDLPTMINFDLIRGEDGVWRILARTQTHMYEEGAVASSFLQPTVQSFFSAFGTADGEALEDLLTPDLPDYQRALLGVMNDEMDRLMQSGQQISVSLDSFQLFDENETWCAGQMEGTLTVAGGEPSPLAFGFEATMTEGTWRFSSLSFDEGPVLPAAPAPDFRPDSSTLEKLLTSYVAALNTRDLDNLFSLLWTEDLTALQMSCVQSFYQNENYFDRLLERQYWYSDRTTLFGSEAAGYEEDEVSLIVSGPNWNMVLFRLDFIQTEEGWRILPDSAAFHERWPESVRPDWSHLSPKHAVAHYLDRLEYGDSEGALSCLDLTGLSEEEKENYRFSVNNLIGVGLRNIIATSSGDTLFRAEYRSENELTLSFEDYFSLVEVRLTQGEDGVWRIVPNPELMLGFYPD